MKKLVGAGLLPLLFAVVAFWYGWPLFGGDESLIGREVWSFIGILMGYWGVLFSAYAAYEVRALSSKYFAKTRFPQVKSNFEGIAIAMGKVANKHAADLRPERFISKIPVALGEIERIPGHEMQSLINRAKKERKELIDWLDKPENQSRSANDSAMYWNLFRTINQISEEINAYLKEQEAR